MKGQIILCIIDKTAIVPAITNNFLSNFFQSLGSIIKNVETIVIAKMVAVRCRKEYSKNIGVYDLDALHPKWAIDRKIAQLAVKPPIFNKSFFMFFWVLISKKIIPITTILIIIPTKVMDNPIGSNI